MDSNVIDYQILSSESLAKLSDLVKKALETGWQPLGGVSVSESVRNIGCGHERTDYTFAQAMGKFEVGIV